jgi:hypothetical protein
MCWDVCCGMRVENTTQYNYIYECYLVLFGKPEQTLGISYMHVRGVYMMCGVLPSLVSWVFVEYCSRETPGIQVGAGNISYHSQITKQTGTHTCHTAIFNVHELHGHTLDISLGACGLRSSTQVSLWESCYGELGQSRVTNKV